MSLLLRRPPRPDDPFTPDPNDVLACAANRVLSVASANDNFPHENSIHCPCMPVVDYEFALDDGLLILDHHYQQ